MKLGHLILGTLFCAPAAFSEEIYDESTATELNDFELDYVIEEYKEVAHDSVAEMNSGEQIKLLYTLRNNEETDITIVGVGGSFKSLLTGDSIANLTSSAVGPVVVPPEGSSSIGQRITLDLEAGNYILSPQVFVAYKDELKAIQARSQLLVVKDAPLSLLDPQLLFLEVLLLAETSGMRLYLNERPRTFIVLDANYSLILRHPNPTYNSHNRVKRHAVHKHHDGTKNKDRGNPHHVSGASNKVIVEFVKTEFLDLSSFKDITPSRTKHNKTLLGFIGLLYVKRNIHLGFITRSTRVASPRINENINVVNDVTFYCLNNDEFDSTINLSEEESNTHMSNEETDIHHKFPSLSVQKLLRSGHFYYSDDFDITSNLQERGLSRIDSNRVSADTPYFKSFMWNTYMISEIIDFRNGLNPIEKQSFDAARFLTIITRGYAKTINISLDNNEEALLTLISKQSCVKNGPLFGDWGCDDDGAVSNFVESEVVIYCEKFCFAYVLLRGNVPSFWELQNSFSKKSIISKNSKKLVLTRSFEAAQHAFNKHFDSLGNQYGDIHVIDCLSRDQSSYKGQLKDNFKEHLQSYWTSTGKTSGRTSDEEKDTSGAVTNYNLSATDMPISTSFMKKIGYSLSNPSELIGPLLESIVNFGALFYDFSQETYVGKQLGIFRVNSFDCLAKANFISKLICQEVIDLAFRDMNIRADGQIRTQHAKLWKENDDVLKELTQNYLSTSTSIPTGRGAKRSLKAQLTKKYLNVVGEVRPNEMAMRKLLGRLQDQEAVRIYNPLHQYISVEMKKRSSEYSYKKDIKVFASTFNVNGDHDIIFIGLEEIVELTPGKMMNVRSENLLAWEAQIKRVLESSDSKRTRYVALWSGQMGGLAILLFIKAEHVGHITNVESAIRDHDAVIWVGDFNYRISMSNETVRSLVEEKNYAKLFEYDQLNKQMAKGESFPFYDEMEITFPPTYKFDNHTYNYDTSDKQRIPQTYKCCEDIIFSDHRPVFATFKASVVMVNESVKKQVSHEIYEGIKELSEDDVLRFVEDVAEKDMPPPSSESSKWWLERGLPAKAVVKEFSENVASDEAIINPRLPVNPFQNTTEPEVIKLILLFRWTFAFLNTEGAGIGAEQSQGGIMQCILFSVRSKDWQMLMVNMMLAFKRGQVFYKLYKLVQRRRR
ncbi:hypothetical protein CXQ85_001361 [Candidozyma haemuli]|uniref:phosphoinositide 5-phosphatase n=1 Tax=Candidozyma haemuli TaxID=45357 RepID=A0A2V1AND2_9ASCO|nr:hypothetical protein CXQ85_001361 [[Candida] haemuloni]PVH19066.1 hypothetical protein CXQ85_001361 [[Candida] haemuloni]